MLYGLGGKLLYAATRVALPPLVLAHVGLAEYGLWAACFVLVGYVGMAASGFTLVYLRRTALHHAQGDVAAIGRLLSTGMLVMGALTGALLGALWLGLPALLDLFRVDAAQRALASWLWMGTLAVFLADMSGDGLTDLVRIRNAEVCYWPNLGHGRFVLVARPRQRHALADAFNDFGTLHECVLFNQ